jgi:hypothetical protein
MDRKDIDLVDIALPNHPRARGIAARRREDRPLRKPWRVRDRRPCDGRRRTPVPNKVWFTTGAAGGRFRAAAHLGRPARTIFHYNASYMQQWGADTTRAATWRMDPAMAGSGAADIC